MQQSFTHAPTRCRVDGVMKQIQKKIDSYKMQLSIIIINNNISQANELRNPNVTLVQTMLFSEA